MTPVPPKISPLLWNAFGRYAEWYVPRHFHGIRLLQSPVITNQPTIIYLNHPSWWDPMMCLLLARKFWPGRKHYAPIDAAALTRYRFFRKLGFFGVEPTGARGGIEFLRTATAILQQPNTVLWITAQGQFTDPRQRPIELRPGLSHLLRRLDAATVLPLALEYPFWDERYPEALATFGSPVDFSQRQSASEWNVRLVTALESTADHLASATLSRDPAGFSTLQRGAAGVSLIYDAWLRLKAVATGHRYREEHGSAVR